MCWFVFGWLLWFVDVVFVVDGLISLLGDIVVGFYEDCMKYECIDVLEVFVGILIYVLVGMCDVLILLLYVRCIVDNVEGVVLIVVWFV